MLRYMSGVRACIQGEADRTLIYITLYITECLKKLQRVIVKYVIHGSKILLDSGGIFIHFGTVRSILPSIKVQRLQFERQNKKTLFSFIIRELDNMVF